MNKLRFNWLIISIFVGFFTTPAVIFALDIFIGNIHPIDSISKIVNEQFGSGYNLFLLSLYGLIPFILHGVYCYWYGQIYNKRTLNCYGLTGLTSILSCMIPMHALTWLPLYGHERTSSTGAIAFIFILTLSKNV